MLDKLLNIKEVADVLGVSTRTVRRIVASGQLSIPKNVGKRNSRWLQSEIITYIKRMR